MDMENDEDRVAVWMALAEHFLDTETRPDIPHAALTCVSAGYDAEKMREIWACEVSPAVGFNLYLVAGEWGCWDEEWLVERIERIRARRSSRLLRRLRYRCGGWPLNGVRVAIERCMAALLDTSSEDREQRARDLTWLAQHYFDFCAGDPAERTRQEIERLGRLRDTTLHCFVPAAVGREARLGAGRVERALGM